MPSFVYCKCNEKIFSLLLGINDSTFEQASMQRNICNGQQFDFYGTSLTTAGNYQHTLSNSAGCDSVVNLTLQVMDNSNTVIDTAILQGGSIVLSSGNVVNVPGTYRDTLLSSSGCDSVLTFNVSVISGLPNVDNSNYWYLMPNPAHNQVNLNVTGNFVGSEYQFTNMLGQLMLTGRIQQTSTTISTATLPAGIYLVRVGNFIKRLVKE